MIPAVLESLRADSVVRLRTLSPKEQVHMTLGRRGLLVASALALTLGLPSLTRAQSLTGSISGTVADAQGGMLPGADVALTNQDSKTVQRTVTNGEGVFVFASVP